MMIRGLALFLGMALRCVGEGVAMPLISGPSLSPDGTKVVFAWCEDLWTASSAGGEAKRVVADPGRDSAPRFSPDGERIVFCSERSGSMQVYSIPVDGGEAVRHTFHSEGNQLECLSPDGKRAIVRGLRERRGSKAMRLMEIDMTAERRERRIFDATAHSASWSRDGKTLLFCRGGEFLWRKGYRGSRASRIWSYDFGSGAFKLEVPGEFEASSPMWLPDGGGFYYVSNEGGTGNLWRKGKDGDGRQMTFFEDDGVVDPQLSQDGSTLLFRKGVGVFRIRLSEGMDAMEVRFHTKERLPADGFQTKKTDCRAADCTAGGESVVFAAEGELWWIPQAGAKAQRVTESVEYEDQPRFSPDGRYLYYLCDDGVSANYRRAVFVDGALSEVSEVTRGEGSKTGLEISRDGRRIAWIAKTGDVYVADADGGQARLVFPCWDRPTIDWSPDGRWLAVAAEDRNSNRDILLVKVDGEGRTVNLTRRPGFEGSPKWSPCGRWLVYNSKRDPISETMLWKIDLGPGGLADEVSDAFLQQAGERAEAISTKGIEPTRAIWHPDGKQLWFQSRNSSNDKVYSIKMDNGEMKSVAKGRGVPIRFTKEGKLVCRFNGVPRIVGESDPVVFPIDISIERSRAEVARIAFRRIWRTLGERFHDPRMNGRDWKKMLERYEPSAMEARTSRQFDSVVSRLMGELNASHLVFQRKAWPGERREVKEAATAHTGVVFDDRESDPEAPLVVKRVVRGSPVAELKDAPRSGEVVTHLGGEKVLNGTALHRLLDGADGKILPMTIQGADRRERVIEVRAISYARARALDALAEMETAAEKVAELSPETGYVAIRDMSRKSLEALELAVHRMGDERERLILDLRDNSGGREADRMLSIFTQVPHAFTVSRNGPKGYPLDRLRAPAWNKPLVILCNEGCYSNSEILCHAMKHTRRAPLVGTATSGGVISAVKVAIPDVGSLQVPFRSWFLAATGENLELNGAEPDHLVELGPAEEDRDSDPQLERAIRVVEEIR